MALIECSECKCSVSDKAESCPQCGFPFKPQQVAGETAGHGVPALLSFFVPGLGQLVRGQVLDAIGVWLLFGVAVFIVREFTFFHHAQVMWLLIMWAMIWIRQVVDAYRVKKSSKASWMDLPWTRKELQWSGCRVGLVVLFGFLGVIVLIILIDQLGKVGVYESAPPLKTETTQRKSASSQQHQAPVSADPSPLADRGFDSDEMAKIKAILRQNPCDQRQQCTVQGFQFRGVYLNDDEQPEFLIQRPDKCGSGGCQEVLLGLIEGKWSPLAQVELGGIAVKKGTTRSMRDIALFDHKEATDTGFYYRFRHFSWDGSQYKLVSVARELSRPN